MTSLSELARAITAGDRRALARGITLIESGHEDDGVRALELWESLPTPPRAVPCFGFCGPPGVGKSSLIEALGTVMGDRRVAILAVDPGSRSGGGAILGDSLRMERLSGRAGVFIRGMSAGEHLGGVAVATPWAIRLLEAAGYEMVLIESVGLGQSETALADIADVVCLLIAPGGGDEIQGLKGGVMDIADVVAVTKVDGTLLPAARHTELAYKSALAYRHKAVEVLKVSSHTGDGIVALWSALLARWEGLGAELEAIRRRRMERMTLAYGRWLVGKRFQRRADLARYQGAGCPEQLSPLRIARMLAAACAPEPEDEGQDERRV